MGPRLFNRGKEAIADQVEAALLPSMGPRLFNRGKEPWAVFGASGKPAFNGAAVIQPRKRVRDKYDVLED